MLKTHQQAITEYNVSGTTQTSFLAKFKATQNKLGPKRQHHSVIYIYIHIYYTLGN